MPIGNIGNNKKRECYETFSGIKDFFLRISLASDFFFYLDLGCSVLCLVIIKFVSIPKGSM